MLPPGAHREVGAQREAVARGLRVGPERVVGLEVLKESLDARRAPVRFRLQVRVGVDEALPEEEKGGFSPLAVREGALPVLIVGAGPAGLFAALRCLELGRRPVLLERGKDASARRFDLAPILREGRVVEESNYCFGEGGAGTFSDGKLYTRAKKRGSVAEVYRLLVEHGAPEDILYEAHPHIGSNLLPKVVMALRESIREAGGEVHFEKKVTELVRTVGGQVVGVRTAGGEEWRGAGVILATGHSARDIYRLLAREGLMLEGKPFAVGVRIEHPQPLIDGVQYHLEKGKNRPDALPAARYRLATQVEGRSVHSFCMCPGGFVVPSATQNDEVVVNGMSLSRRDSPFANSGLVVGVEPSDVREGALAKWLERQADWREEREKWPEVLLGLAFQKWLERRAKVAGGGGQVAPGQRVVDFLKLRVSRELLETSYFPGLHAAPLHEIFPRPLSVRLGQGLRRFGRQIAGYEGESAQLLGFETRTSSPVRIPREAETLQHPEAPGLFPCAEGAGYAGGIVSAALDGRRCAEAACGIL